jgi:tetratricopeptide (TPR) repeat protein
LLQAKADRFNFKKKYVISILAILGAAIIMALSNKPGQTSNGLPVIENDAQYNDALDVVTRNSQSFIGKFNAGLELESSDREVALKDAKIFDNMDTYRPDMAAGYFTAGLFYYLAGDTDSAENRLTQSLADSTLPNNLKTFEDKEKVEAVVADCHHMLSLVFFDRHDYKRAVDEADLAIQHLDKREAYFFARAQAEVEMKKIPAAKADLEKSLQLNPNYLPSSRLLGFLNH